LNACEPWHGGLFSLLMTLSHKEHRTASWTFNIHPSRILGKVARKQMLSRHSSTIRRPGIIADPKQIWAQLYLANKPIEINKAEKRDLIRIPGIGLKGAEAILNARRLSGLRDLSSLKKLGIIAERAAPYLLFNGHRAATQMKLL
jgi:hypothetical protein